MACAEKQGRYERYKPTLRAPADRHKSASEGRGSIHLRRELPAIAWLGKSGAAVFLYHLDEAASDEAGARN